MAKPMVRLGDVDKRPNPAIRRKYAGVRAIIVEGAQIGSAIMKDRVQKTIEKIKPMLEADGGSVELLSVDEGAGIVKVKLTGACGSCPHAAMTLKNVVERMIREEVPEVKEVTVG